MIHVFLWLDVARLPSCRRTATSSWTAARPLRLRQPRPRPANRQGVPLCPVSLQQYFHLLGGVWVLLGTSASYTARLDAPESCILYLKFGWSWVTTSSGSLSS